MPQTGYDKCFSTVLHVPTILKSIQHIIDEQIFLVIANTRILYLACKRLLNEVFVTSRIIEVEIGVISRGRKLMLITLTEASIILDITKTESNNCFIIH